MPKSPDLVQQAPGAASPEFETTMPGSKYTAWLAAALIGLFLIAVTLEGRAHSPATDEPPHIAAGLSYFVTHEIFRADPQHPPLLKELSALSMMGNGIRWPHTKD